MNRLAMIPALAALAAGTAFATIAPTRVGPVSTYGALQAGKNSAGEGRIYGSVNGAVDGKEVQVKGLSLGWRLSWPHHPSFYGPSYPARLLKAPPPAPPRS